MTLKSRFLWMHFVFLLGLTLFGPQSRADTIGPLPNGFQIVSVPTTITIPTFLGVQISIPFDGSIGIGIDNTQTFTVNVPVPIIQFSYIQLNIIPLPGMLNQNMLATDITALALGGANDLIATGFNPATPQVVPASLESFIGHSGTIYTSAPIITSTLGGLAALFPGFDLTGFSGDPNSIVYIAQTLIPVADAVIPLPGALPLFATGLGGLVLLGWRKKRRAVA